MAESRAAPVLVRHGGVMLPPGFRFRPTDEELVLQYLRCKAFGLPLPAAVIDDLHNLFKLDPWDIPGASEGEKYFFAVRPATVGVGGRSRRTATANGCWKPAGGRDKPVVASRCGRSHLVGVKKAMVFVPRPGKKGSAAADGGSGWVMHEYRLAIPPHSKGCLAQSEEWVVCRIFQTTRSARRRTQEDDGETTGATAARRTLSAATTSADSCVTSSGRGQEEEEVSSS